MYASHPAQNPVAAARQCERRDEDAEDGPNGIEPGEVRQEGRRQEDGADHVREPRRPRVLERSLAEVRLHQLEVGEARQAVPSPERQADDELEREQREKPRPTGDNRDEGERTDDDLIEAWRA